MVTANASDYQEPDFKAIAQDLKSKGLTYQDIEEQGTAVLRNAPAVTLTNPEGSRPSDPESVKPSQKDGGTPESVKRLLQAYEGLETEGVVSQQGTQVQVDNEFALPSDNMDSEWAMEVDATLKDIPTKTEGSNRELARIISGITEEDVNLAFESLQSGAEDLYANTVGYVAERINTTVRQNAESKIKEASTPEEVVSILKDVQRNNKGNISLSDLRAFSINKLPEVIGERSGYVTQHIVRSMYLAQEITKRETEIANSSTFLEKVGDFLEYVPPILGVASEERSKYRQSISDVVEKLDKATPDQQMGVLNAALDWWEADETLLFENNNSFMTMSQFGAMKDLILQGGYLLSEGDMTTAQRNQYVESLANLGFEVTTVTGIFDSVKSLVKYINVRTMNGYQNANRVITPEIFQQTMQSMNPESVSPTTVKAKTPTEVTFTEEPKFVNRKETLKKAASQKNTTLFRKTLEEEKKDLGAMKSEVESKDVNKEARQLSKDKKIKFKEALKEVKETANREIIVINNRLSAVQEHISKFDTAGAAEAELSRINQFIKDGKISEDDLLVPTGVVQVKPTLRTQSNVIDTEYLEVPLNKIKKEKEEGLKGIQKDSGLSAEEVAARQIPSPNDSTDAGFPNSPTSRKELNDLILSEGDEVTIGMGLAREVERQAGTSLTPVHSATAFKGYSDNDNSQGMFTFLLQDGARGGFDNASDARQAATKGLAGYDWRIVEKDGKFSVEVDVEHYINPDIDAKGLYTDPSKTVKFGKAFLNPLRILGSEVLKGFYALKGVARSRVQKMETRFKDAVRPLNSSQGFSLDKALKQGDLEGVEWSKFQEFKSATGIQDNQVFIAYREMREIYDEIYEIRKKNYYNKLRAANMKFIDVEDGNLGRVLNPNSKIDMETNDGLVLDIESGNLIKADPSDGMSYVRLTNPVRDVNTGDRFVVRMKSERVSKLPTDVLNNREGHMDRMYRDAGWIVSVPRRGLVEGVESDLKPQVTHIVSSEADARRIAEEEGGLAQRARENDDLEAMFGNDDDVQFTYGSSHTKKRNEILSGADGNDASILNAFEAMGKAISGADRELSTNMFNSLRARFYHEFEDILKEGKATPFDASLKSMIDSKYLKTGDKNRISEMRNWHSYIRKLASGEKHAAYKAMDDALSPVFDPILKFANKTTDTRRVIDAIQNMASEVYVVWNPLYQMPQNLVPSIYLVGTGGVSGVRAAISLTALKGAYQKGNYKRFSKIMGITETQTKDLMDEMRRSGLVDAVGRSNDFLDLARGDLNVGATSKGKAALQGAKRYGYSGARDTMREGQEGTIALMNMLSYITEYKKLLKSGKKFDAGGKVQVSFQTQKSLQTQNSLDQFWYQGPDNVLKPFYQFFQYMHKLALDIVIEPQYRVVTGLVETVLKRKFSEGRYFGKEAGKYSDTYAKALVTTMITYGVFGVKGGLGSNMGTLVEDNLREKFPELAGEGTFETAMDGALSETFNATVKSLGGQGAVDITTNYGPAGFFDMINDFVIEGFPALNPFGVSGIMSTSLARTTESVITLGRNPNIDTWDKFSEIVPELLTILPLMKNIEKAGIAMMFEQMPAAKTLSGKAKVEFIEGMMLAVNIQPDLVVDYYSKSNFSGPETTVKDIFKDRSLTNRITDTMLRAFARELSQKKLYHSTKSAFSGDGFDTQVPFSERNELLRKWSEAAKSLVHKDYWSAVEERFKEKALMSGSATYEEYEKNYIDRAKSGNRGSSLNVLEQKANSDEARKVFGLTQDKYELQDEMYKILEENDG